MGRRGSIERKTSKDLSGSAFVACPALCSVYIVAFQAERKFTRLLKADVQTTSRDGQVLSAPSLARRA